MRRLLPDPAPIELEEQLGQLELTERAHDDRPYVVANFAMTLDGRASIAGKAGPIGSKTDAEMLLRLRTRVDAVVIGAGTMRVERYGRLVRDPQLRAYRERVGLAHDPLAVIVSGTLDLPWDAGLFSSGGGRVLIFTSAETEPPDTPTPVRIERHSGKVDLVSALATLRRERGIRALLCEGGPHLQAEMLRAGLIDELFLTIAPKLSGERGAPTIVEGALELPLDMELLWLLEDDGELFTRWRSPPGP